MLITIIIVVALALLGYVLRRNFRRFWHVLYTGDEEPDWEKLGGDYFIASWERKRFELKKAAKGEATTLSRIGRNGASLKREAKKEADIHK